MTSDEKHHRHISFIMPAYNCAWSIEESVKSIMDGNFQDGDELVITDDGSTDSTSVILASLKSRYASVKVLTHKENLGPSAARNTAIVAAKNSLLFNLDSDDILVQGSIPKLKAYLISTDADVAVFEESRFFRNGTGKVTHSRMFRLVPVTLADCMAGPITPAGSGNCMFTKESWVKAGGYPEFARTYEAWGFGFRQLATGAKMVVMPNSFYLHRYGHASNWNRERRRGNTSLKVLRIIEPFLRLFHEEDVAYIMEHKKQWLSNLRKHPIRVKGCAPGQEGGVKIIK